MAVDRLHLGEVGRKRLHEKLTVAGVDVERAGSRDFIQRLLPELLVLGGRRGLAERGGELLGEDALHLREHLVRGRGEVGGESVEEVGEPGNARAVVRLQRLEEGVQPARRVHHGLQLDHARLEGRGDLVGARHHAVDFAAGGQAEGVEEVRIGAERTQHDAEFVLVGEYRPAHDVSVGPAGVAVDVVASRVVGHHEFGDELVDAATARLDERLAFAGLVFHGQLDHLVELVPVGRLHLPVEFERGRAVEARHAVAVEAGEPLLEERLRVALGLQHAAREFRQVRGGHVAEFSRERAGDAGDHVQRELAGAAGAGVEALRVEERERRLASVDRRVGRDLVFDLREEAAHVEGAHDRDFDVLPDLVEMVFVRIRPVAQLPDVDVHPLLRGEDAVRDAERELYAVVGNLRLGRTVRRGHLLEHVVDGQRLRNMGGRRDRGALEEHRAFPLLGVELRHRIQILQACERRGVVIGIRVIDEIDHTLAHEGELIREVVCGGLVDVLVEDSQAHLVDAPRIAPADHVQVGED